MSNNVNRYSVGKVVSEPSELLLVQQQGSNFVVTKLSDIPREEYDYLSCTVHSQLENNNQLGVVTPQSQRISREEKINEQIDNLNIESNE